MGLVELLEDLDRAVDAVVRADLEGCDDRLLEMVLRRLTGAGRRVESARLDALGRLQDRAAAAGRPDREVRDLLRCTAGTTAAAATSTLATAAALRELPATRAALRRGAISGEKAAIIARGVQGVDAADDRAVLDRTGASVGQVCDERQLRRALTETRYRLDPQDLRERERRAIQRRELSLTDTPEGMVRGHLLLPVAHAEPVRTVIDALARPHSAADDRSQAQRQADALVEVCRRTLERGGSAEAGGYLPQVTVTVAAATLQDEAGAPPAQLAFGGPVSAETARQFGCAATVARVVLGPASVVVDVGRARRTATVAQRRALIARDRGCVGCGAAPGWCQAHHVRWWRHGGRTDIANLALVCWACHDNIHHAGWQVTIERSGRRRLRPPGPDHPTASAGTVTLPPQPPTTHTPATGSEAA